MPAVVILGFLALVAMCSDAQTYPVLATCNTSDAAQIWSISAHGSVTNQISVSLPSGDLCFDVYACHTAAGTPISAFACDDGSTGCALGLNEQFSFSAGYLYSTFAPSMCVGINGAAVQWDLNSTTGALTVSGSRDGTCVSATGASASLTLQPCPTVPVTITADGSARGLRFDGVGSITSNGQCRLVFDYPEPARSQILDYLFKPGFGLSLHTLKVEIGSDVQSTIGTEASFQHVRGQVDYAQGVQYWYMQQARLRNPNILISALEWSAPGWVGNGSFFSQDNIDYLLGWIHGAEVVYNQTLNFLGIWNEPPISFVPTDWLVSLRAQLDAAGFGHVEIVAPDWSPTGDVTMTLLSNMTTNVSVRDAVAYVGTHNGWSSPPAAFTQLQQTAGKRAWISESWHDMGSWLGATHVVDDVLGNHLGGNYTGWQSWGLISATYPNLLCQDKALTYATSPWSGQYDVQPPVWTTAQITQFSQPGWLFLLQGRGSGSLQPGVPPGTGMDVYVTLLDPKDTSNITWSMIFGAFYSSAPVPVTISLLHLSAGGAPLQLWCTNESTWFIRMPDVDVPPGGSFNLTLPASSMCTLATAAAAANASKGVVNSTRVMLPTRFPLPYSDNFDGGEEHKYARYFVDWDGSFALLPDPSPAQRGLVMTQRTMQTPIPWHCHDVPPLSFIAPGYGNVVASVDAAFDAAAVTAASTSFVQLCVRVNKPSSGWCPAAAGLCLQLYANGTAVVLAARDNVARVDDAQADMLARLILPPVAAYTWSTLTLTAYADTLTATVNGTAVGSGPLAALAHDFGLSGIGSGFHAAYFDNFSISSSTPASGPVPANLVVYPTFVNDGVMRPNASMPATTALFGLALAIDATAPGPVALQAVARMLAANSSGVHAMYVYDVNSTAPTAMATASVDMSDRSTLDALNLVYATMATPVQLLAGHVYVVVSEEVLTGQGDVFYGLGQAPPCLGDAGQGATLPRMDVSIPYVSVLGGVTSLLEALSGFTPVPLSGPGNLTWALYTDYRARSFGPLALVMQ